MSVHILILLPDGSKVAAFGMSNAHAVVKRYWTFNQAERHSRLITFFQKNIARW